ncbi:MAG: hypothetical protein HY455_02745 [Parcubacteria group bacterium]|nr:hypothetical protein [Parcubacteria group bacterium]
MRAQITWFDVVSRGNNPQMKFGDVQVMRRDGSVLRGPVKGVRREGRENIIEVIWVAEKKTPQSEWVRQTPDPIVITFFEGQPFLDGNTIEATIPELGELKLFRKGEASYLDPSVVTGLQGNEVRQYRAWLYDIPLDSNWERIVNRVVHDLGAGGLASEYEQMQVQDEAAAFKGQTTSAAS